MKGESSAIRASFLLVWLVLTSGAAAAGPAVPPAPLPPPAGAVVRVTTVTQLQNAVAAIASNTTILIAPGTYDLTTTLYINGTFTNVGIRGEPETATMSCWSGKG